MKKLCIFALALGLFLAAATYSSKAEEPPYRSFRFDSFDEFLEKWPYLSTLDCEFQISFKSYEDMAKAEPYLHYLSYGGSEPTIPTATTGNQNSQGTDISSEPTNPSTSPTNIEKTNSTNDEKSNLTNIYLWVGIACAAVLVIAGVMLGIKKKRKD